MKEYISTTECWTYTTSPMQMLNFEADQPFSLLFATRLCFLAATFKSKWLEDLSVDHDQCSNFSHMNLTLSFLLTLLCKFKNTSLGILKMASTLNWNTKVEDKVILPHMWDYHLQVHSYFIDSRHLKTHMMCHLDL